VNGVADALLANTDSLICIVAGVVEAEDPTLDPCVIDDVNSFGASSAEIASLLIESSNTSDASDDSERNTIVSVLDDDSMMLIIVAN